MFRVLDGFNVVSMDYIPYAKGAATAAVNLLRGLSTSTKVAILAVIAFLALIVYLRSRDTAGNNLRRARELHQKAVELHEKGNTGEAAALYQKASECREKAEGQK